MFIGCLYSGENTLKQSSGDSPETMTEPYSGSSLPWPPDMCLPHLNRWPDPMPPD